MNTNWYYDFKLQICFKSKHTCVHSWIPRIFSDSIFSMSSERTQIFMEERDSWEGYQGPVSCRSQAPGAREVIKNFITSRKIPLLSKISYLFSGSLVKNIGIINIYAFVPIFWIHAVFYSFLIFRFLETNLPFSFRRLHCIGANVIQEEYHFKKCDF